MGHHTRQFNPAGQPNTHPYCKLMAAGYMDRWMDGTEEGRAGGLPEWQSGSKPVEGFRSTVAPAICVHPTMHGRQRECGCGRFFLFFFFLSPVLFFDPLGLLL